MARPSKSVESMSKHMSKEEKKARIESEKTLKGASDMLTPPEHLNDVQKELFNYFVEQMKVSGILGNLDVSILESCVIAIERLRHIETSINENLDLMLDNNIMRARKGYMDTFFRCCNELSLSPQSRAKLGIIAVQAKQHEGDDLLKVLRGGVG